MGVNGLGSVGVRVGVCLALALASSIANLAAFAHPAAAEMACGNRPYRVGPSATLPDCRAYEQVSPVDKRGANIQRTLGIVEASADGSRLTFADAGGLPTTGGSGPNFVASRFGGAWSTNGLTPPLAGSQEARLLGWDEQISTSANTITGGGVGTGLSLGDVASGSYALALPSRGRGGAALAGFAEDNSHLIFESYEALLPGAVAGYYNLYDLDHGALSLVGRIPTAPATFCDDAGAPACEPAPTGAFAGPYDWENASFEENGGAHSLYYTQSTISADGSRVVFTAAGSGQLYLRENGTTTRQISASKRAVPDPNGAKPAAFMAATPSDSKVFFASCQKLTEDSTAVSTAAPGCTEVEENAPHAPVQGQDLYLYDSAAGTLTDLSVDPNAGDPFGAQVLGVLGASPDGSYVYFAANGVLAAGASAGSCGIGNHNSEGGSCNLYLWHEGSLSFVARLDSRYRTEADPSGALLPTGDADNWRASAPQAASEGFRSARVAADGTLLFSSVNSLTGYDSACSTGSPSPGKCAEFYRYEPGGEKLECVSCDPSGAPPSGSARLGVSGIVFGPEIHSTFLTRNLSADGDRVFFESPDALVPADTNGVLDAYEWEAPGSGSCDPANAVGCLYLLSGGTSPQPSYFGDADREGNNAYFFTSQALVPADRDELVDAYDARVEGGLASQQQSSAPACDNEDACQGPPAAPPGAGSPGTTAFDGPGNKPKQPNCKKHTKHCKKHRRHHKKHHRRHPRHVKHAKHGGGM